MKTTFHKYLQKILLSMFYEKYFIIIYVTKTPIMIIVRSLSHRFISLQFSFV